MAVHSRVVEVVRVVVVEVVVEVLEQCTSRARRGHRPRALCHVTNTAILFANVGPAVRDVLSHARQASSNILSTNVGPRVTTDTVEVADVEGCYESCVGQGKHACTAQARPQFFEFRAVQPFKTCPEDSAVNKGGYHGCCLFCKPLKTLIDDGQRL